jgi:hypothetical protein
MLNRGIAHRAVDQFAKEKIGIGFSAARFRVIPITLLGGRRMIIATQTTIPFGSQMEIDLALADWQMSQDQCFAKGVELCGFLSSYRSVFAIQAIRQEGNPSHTSKE